MDFYTDTQWFLKPSFDFEMKQYQYLAIDQKVTQDLNHTKLWPWHDYLSETIDLMGAFRKSAENQKNSWKKALSHVDLKNSALFYQSSQFDNNIDEVHQIIDFVYPRLSVLQGRMQETKADLITNIEVRHVGLFASRIHIGFLAVEHMSGLRLYDYYLPGIAHRHERLDLNYLDTVDSELPMPKLIKHVYQISPGPYKQFWHVTGTNELPLKESLEPIVSSHMVGIIRQAS